MSQTLVLHIPDGTWAELQRTAEVRHVTPEQAALEVLSEKLGDPIESDPLFRLFGTVESDLSDVGRNHDEYLGRSLAAELHRDQ